MPGRVTSLLLAAGNHPMYEQSPNNHTWGPHIRQLMLLASYIHTTVKKNGHSYIVMHVTVCHKVNQFDTLAQINYELECAIKLIMHEEKCSPSLPITFVHSSESAIAISNPILQYNC